MASHRGRTESGSRTARNFETEEEAIQVVRSLKRESGRAAIGTVQEAREKYEMYMRDEKHNKQRSYTPPRRGGWGSSSPKTISCSRAHARALQGLLRRPADASAAEDKAAARVDSHRNILAEAKTFLGGPWEAVICAQSARRVGGRGSGGMGSRSSASTRRGGGRPRRCDSRTRARRARWRRSCRW